MWNREGMTMPAAYVVARFEPGSRLAAEFCGYLDKQSDAIEAAHRAKRYANPRHRIRLYCKNATKKFPGFVYDAEELGLFGKDANGEPLHVAWPRTLGKAIHVPTTEVAKC